MKINQLHISITILTVSLLLLEQLGMKANSLSDKVYLPSSIEEVKIDSSEQINSTSGQEYSQSYQPGRTKAHQIRMRKIERETELLQAQKQIVEAQLQRLQQQIRSAEKQL